MTTQYKILYSVLVIGLLILPSAQSVFASYTPPGTSRACFKIDGTVIDLTGLPCLQIGTSQICADADFAKECKKLGGRWGSVMPQYVGPGRTNGPVQDINDFFDIMIGIIKVFQIAFWILTVGFGLYAAYLYLFAAGNKESAQKARRVFLYTIIAAVLAVLAYAVPAVIDKFLTG